MLSLQANQLVPGPPLTLQQRLVEQPQRRLHLLSSKRQGRARTYHSEIFINITLPWLAQMDRPAFLLWGVGTHAGSRRPMPKKNPPARRRVLAEFAGHRSIGTTALDGHPDLRATRHPVLRVPSKRKLPSAGAPTLDPQESERPRQVQRDAWRGGQFRRPGKGPAKLGGFGWNGPPLPLQALENPLRSAPWTPSGADVRLRVKPRDVLGRRSSVTQA